MLGACREDGAFTAGLGCVFPCSAVTPVSWRGNPAGAQARRVPLALSGLTKKRRFAAFPLCSGYKKDACSHCHAAKETHNKLFCATGSASLCGAVGSGGTAAFGYAPPKCHHSPKNVPRGVVRGTSTSLPLWLRFGAALVVVALGACSPARDGVRCRDLQAAPPQSRGFGALLAGRGCTRDPQTPPGGECGHGAEQHREERMSRAMTAPRT